MIDDLEMFDILLALYPSLVTDDDDGYDLACDFNGGILWLGGVEIRMAEFVTRLLTLTHPVNSALTGTPYHAFIKDGTMLAKLPVKGDA